jgi:four helix bundle protein
MKTYFDHEKLDVYQDALTFCGWAGELIDRVSARAAVKDQLDRASTSVPQNIAEGNGKYSNADRARYFEIARGSALECAACLDVLVVRDLVSREEIEPGKERLSQIVKMLMGLLRRFSAHSPRVAEDSPDYPIGDAGDDYEQEHD